MRNRVRTALACIPLILLGIPVRAAPAPATPVPAAVAQAGPLHLDSPVAARCYSSPFGWRHQVGPRAPAGFHNGIDLPAAAGALVRAPLPGTVSRIKRMGIGGLQVFVEHPGGLMTLYAHLGSVVPALATGRTKLAAGDPIGRIGRTGVTYGTHLFFAVFADGRAIDPNLLLALPPCG